MVSRSVALRRVRLVLRSAVGDSGEQTYRCYMYRRLHQILLAHSEWKVRFLLSLLTSLTHTVLRSLRDVQDERLPDLRQGCLRPCQLATKPRREE